jgi:hypothetical protein
MERSESEIKMVMKISENLLSFPQLYVSSPSTRQKILNYENMMKHLRKEGKKNSELSPNIHTAYFLSHSQHSLEIFSC